MKVAILIFCCLMTTTFAIESSLFKGLRNLNEPDDKENVTHLATFPPFNAEKDMIFYLYNEVNSEEVIKLNNPASLQASKFRSDFPTRIFINGYTSVKKDAQKLRNAYLAKGGVNNIYVDWSKGSQTILYPLAALIRVPQAGKLIARFVDFLVEDGGASYDTTYLIGHSLGAHIMGIAGRNTAEKVNTIIGLDPAGPAFSLNQREARFGRGDAKYVEIIHTTDIAGFYEPLGDADFYPNGGKVQPGLYGIGGSGESHGRSVLYMGESVNNNEFWAVSCSFEDINNDKCNSTNYTVRMGGEPSNGGDGSPPSGTYYLRTNFESPYALGKP